jgi:hypothetical protein
MKTLNQLINVLNDYEPCLVEKIYNIVIWNYIYDIIINSINKKIKEIKCGYEILYYDEDGCDEDGPMYWVDCVNGWYGRHWNVRSSMFNKINSYLNSIDICFMNKIAPEFSFNDKFNALKYYFNTETPPLLIDIYFITDNNLNNKRKKYRPSLNISRSKLTY